LEHTSEQEHEANFVKVFIIVLVALTLFTLLCIFIARGLASSSVDPNDSIMRTALLERITPVASVNTSADQIDGPAATQPATADTASAPETGEEIVTRACAACHAAGVSNAPKLGDDAAWEERRAAGLDALVASVVNGKGAMPARAGVNLSDEKIILAVQHMAGLESDTSAAATTESSEDAATTTAAVASTPTELQISDKAKTVADSLCAGCHIAGLQGAPKLGDKAAWEKRAEMGMDALVKSVVMGKGVMPPRGGSDLTDAEIAEAIQYMMSK